MSASDAHDPRLRLEQNKNKDQPKLEVGNDPLLLPVAVAGGPLHRGGFCFCRFPPLGGFGESALGRRREILARILFNFLCILGLIHGPL